MRFTYQLGDASHSIQIDKRRGGYRAIIDGQELPVRLLRSAAGELTFATENRILRAHWADDGNRKWVSIAGKTVVLTSTHGGSARRKKAHVRLGERMILAPMPGVVRAVQIADNENVSHGQTVLVLEAMKMEIRIPAPHSGRVARVLVQPGQTVEREQILVEMA